MKLIDQFYAREPVDTYTFVFDEISPETGYYAMLAMSADARRAHWTAGNYNPDGANEHLGERTTLAALGDLALDGFFSWLGVVTEYGREANE